MMKRFIIAGIFSLILMASAAHAANGLAVYGSYWASEDMDADYGGGGKLKMLVSSGLSMELRGAYFKGFKKEETDSDGLSAENKFTLIPVEAGLVIDLPMDAISFYAGGGAGYYMFQDGELSIQDDDGSESFDVDYDNAWGWYAVAGVEFPVSGFVLFAEAQYRWLTIKSDDVEVDGTTLPGGEDMKMDGFGGNVGILFPW